MANETRGEGPGLRETHGVIGRKGSIPDANSDRTVRIIDGDGFLEIRCGEGALLEPARLTSDEARRLAILLNEAADRVDFA